ncbi:DUF1330 domain-containing protein [Flavicella marina]|uniref:DUF1330 domain-containing protein n=1 Tax=Flavicella marina TaxID=1475951 RepID=UPI0012649694|nr:DUF1330 domain-containing protein [Flavicella marina]
MIFVTAFLFVKEGKEQVFESYENLVLPLLSDFEGTLIYRVRADKEVSYSVDGEIPYEIHLISFSSIKMFDAFITDEKRMSFQDLQKESIKSTFIVKEEKL